MTLDEILPFLNSSLPDPQFGRPLSASALKEDVYRLQAGSRLFLLKWIANDRPGPHKELAVNREYLGDSNDLAPSLIWSLDLEGGSLACWEWLEGPDLREPHRALLPDAFTVLGAFHVRRRHDGPVFAPTAGGSHDSVDLMITAEKEHLLPVVEPSLRGAAATILDRLRSGYGTLIHGDVHPGNIIKTRDGLRFVDWSLSRPTLNYSDLDYVESVVLNPPFASWPYISPVESSAVLDAYAKGCGIEDVDIHAVHLAMMLWREIGFLEHYLGESTVREERVVGTSARIEQLIQYGGAS